MTTGILSSGAWYRRLADVYEHRSSPGLVEKMADALKFLAQGDSILAFLYTTTQQPVFLYKDANLKTRKRNIEEYISGYYLLDPFYQLSSQYDEPALVHLKNIGDEFYDSEYYETWYQYSGLKDEVNYIIPVAADKVVAISISRDLNARAFAAADLEQMEVILPLVAGVVRTYWHGRPAEDSADASSLHDRLMGAMNKFGKSLLTAREFEIVQLLLRGYSIKLTAARLNISPTTIQVHRKHIYHKLDVRSHSELFSLFIDALSTVTTDADEDPLIRYQ